MHISLRRTLFWTTLAFFSIGPPTARADNQIEIVILAGDSLKSTIRTLHGAKSVLSSCHVEAVFHEFVVGKQTSDNQTIVDSIKVIDPALIFTVGSSATRLATDNFNSTPIVFSAVKYPALSGFVNSNIRPGGNVTGASLDIPIDVQFNYFQKIVPNLKKIGVLYTSSTRRLIDPAAIVAKELGLELVAVEITDKKQLPRALDSLAGTVDGLWSVADPELFNPQSTRYILLNSSRKGLPLMGFSRYVVESGALFALDFDYKAVGRQAGQIACRVIGGQKPGSISVTSADLLWFHYNENTARHIKVVIPEDLVAIAKEVYR